MGFHTFDPRDPAMKAMVTARNTCYISIALAALGITSSFCHSKPPRITLAALALACTGHHWDRNPWGSAAPVTFTKRQPSSRFTRSTVSLGLPLRENL